VVAPRGGLAAMFMLTGAALVTVTGVMELAGAAGLP
jgi:hypothetical protein